MYNGFILSLIFLFILFFSGIILSFLTSAFLIPIFFTPKRVLKEIVKLMSPKEGDTVVDLGSGDGRVLIALRKKANIQAVGYEVSPVMALISNMFKRLNFGFDNSIRFEVTSLFDVNLAHVDKIYCHLSERAMEILSKKFDRELGRGVRVYSYEYRIPKTKHTAVHELSNGASLYVYTY
jgi:hypothetical protein